MKQININRSKCIKCNACVEVCPAFIFERSGGEVVVGDVNDCISCGHCVAICAEEAISHSNFGEGKVHNVGEANVDSKKLLNLIKLRRSNRTFTDKPIPQESLDMIIEAAFRAPTASNMQG